MASTRVPAIRFQQGSHILFQFVIDCKQIQDFARVKHLHREGDDLVGFQRPEIVPHIRSITSYLESGNPLMPNSIIVGFHKAPRFSPHEKGLDIGTITLTENEMGLIVDGQQRSAAYRDAQIEGLPVSVVGWVAESEQEMTEHFLRLGSSKPLPKAMLSELLPGIDVEINAELNKKRLPIILTDRLNRDSDSPLYGLIKSATNPQGIVTSATIMRMLEESLTNGYLFTLREDDDVEGMLMVLKNFWSAVASIFKSAWALPARESKLLQSAGVIALSGLMDQASDTLPKERLTINFFRKVLRVVEPQCFWTEGEWNFGPEGKRPWSGLESTVRGINLLKGLLTRLYRASLKSTNQEDAA